MGENEQKKIADFLFEVGTMRKLPRMHQQMLLTQDPSDSIAAHSYRVALISWFLAKAEGADPYKAVMMALTHDIKEVRSGDHNYVHKKYVKIFEEEISRDQLESLPFGDLSDIVKEFEARESKEALIAKDADLLDQILLLKEYAHQGNKEAEIWLNGKGSDTDNVQYRNLKTDAAKAIGKEILSSNPSGWWESLWTPKNR
ncbi:MAG TPA: HD domain-containing protein [Candidatus Paceibacterota bacterium]